MSDSSGANKMRSRALLGGGSISLLLIGVGIGVYISSVWFRSKSYVEFLNDHFYKIELHESGRDRASEELVKYQIISLLQKLSELPSWAPVHNKSGRLLPEEKIERRRSKVIGYFDDLGPSVTAGVELEEILRTYIKHFSEYSSFEIVAPDS